ncbi:uncharacterized protein N7479_001151 [Penicillium vulpinum]|uniref:uncharacterized protein n=1 Tax=Penicillium vulpinum TaxID=29845 RepID=UPI00254739EA|nr:uncharacterized protein N7479_001151 [Penicillium vulpinum]KAJ5971233.1 hypothetical protein N7479_001151 [Penicillium vulpinum]
MEETMATSVKYDDWRDHLQQHGYTIIKNAISPEKAQYYQQQQIEWLEKFTYGFKKDDSTTWTPEYLPAHARGGMYFRYGVQHEAFMWEARQEAGIIDAFAKLWGTDELLVSFDAMNITFPSSNTTNSQPWPHIDQSPQKKGLHCVQGFINFTPNGPEDGGLMVLKGTHKLTEKFFETFPEQANRESWGPEDWFSFEASEIDWFRERGCEPKKVCADPGDLIMWDSRTIHYSVPPQSEQMRALIYLCYTPARFATPENLEKKAVLFKNKQGSTHWPHANLWGVNEKRDRLGKIDIGDRDQPFEYPIETELVLKLAGVKSY